MKKQNGITLIALVISIIVMLILAGVSINAIVGENGVLSRAQYSSFMNEMAAVEEAVQLWKAGELIESKGQVSTAIPSKGLCKMNDVNSIERLSAEIGYYRLWSSRKTMPVEANILSSTEAFNKEYGNELVPYPAGVQDLYYLDNEALDLDKNKVYLIDAATSIVYSTTGITLNGVRCYSTHMAKAVMGNNVAPIFAEAEMSGGGDNIIYAGAEYLKDKDGNYIDENGNIVSEENKVLNPNGFKIIADSSSNNVYKLYNNGDLYGKGIKDFSLNLTEQELADCDTKIWQNFTIPENIGSYKELYQGSNTFYAIDNNGYLWAWGANTSNKLGLTQEQQIEYTGRDAIKLDVDGKKVKKIFSTYQEQTFCVTEDNSLYVAGSNINYNLGLGHNETIYKFTKVDLKDVNGQNISGDKIYNIISAYRYTVIWVNGSEYSVGSNDWYNSNEFYIAGHNNMAQFSNGNYYDYYYYYTKCWDGYLYKFDTKEQKSIKINDTYDASIDVQHKIKSVITGNATAILTIDNTVLVTGSGDHSYQWFDMKDQNTLSSTRKFLPLTTSVKENLEIGTNVQKIASYNCGSVLIWRKNNGNDEIFGSRKGTTVGISKDKAESGYFYKITLPSSLISEGIKDIAVTSTSAYILSNSGKVYGTGGNSGLGLGKENTADIGDGFIELNLPKKIEAMNELSNGTSDQFMILSCEDGTMLAIGNEQIILRDKILQKSWKKIAEDVSGFAVSTYAAAYVTKDNNLYVSGTDSYMLGIGANSSYIVNQYTKVSDFSNNVLEVKIADGMLGVKTIDNKLYVCGYNMLENNQFNGLEHSTNVFELLKDNVGIWDIKGKARFFVSDNVLYEWGQTGDGQILIEGKKQTPQTIPTAVNITAFKLEDLTRIDTNGQRKTTFVANGSLYACSINSGRFEIVGVDGYKLRPFTYNFNENVVKGAHASDLSSMYLTESGKAYSVGIKSLLGIGETDSTTYTLELQQSQIDNIVDIVAGNGFYIAVSTDGKVYGTGSNAYGILGRWKGAPREAGRYRTAFDWVECPELEI